MFFYLVTNTQGAGIGAHVYVDEPATPATDETSCTEDQALNPAAWIVQSGTVVAVTVTLADQAQAMLNAGIQIVSTATSALDGTYPCDAQTSFRAGNLLAAIANGLTIPGGAVQWPDTSGAPHAFSPTDFKNLTQAMLNFEAALTPLIAGATGALPTLPVTIP